MRLSPQIPFFFTENLKSTVFLLPHELCPPKPKKSPNLNPNQPNNPQREAIRQISARGRGLIRHLESLFWFFLDFFLSEPFLNPIFLSSPAVHLRFLPPPPLLPRSLSLPLICRAMPRRFGTARGCRCLRDAAGTGAGRILMPALGNPGAVIEVPLIPANCAPAPRQSLPWCLL